MKFDAAALAQPHIKRLRPYKAGMTTEELARQRGLRPDAIIKLASNENPYGMSPAAADAAKNALSQAHIYPDVHDALTALGGYLGVGAGSVILGNGSTEVLDLIARAFLGKDDNAISSQYGFSMYATVTRAVGAANIIVPAHQFGHDLPAFADAITDQTKVVWIANPNNPTGTFVPYAEVKRFLATVPQQVLVVLDEAYYEYLDPKVRAESHRWIREYPNLVVVRTFSKIHGLAALRVGYGIGHPSVIDALNKLRQPCNINGVGLSAATAALADKRHVIDMAAKNATGLQQLQRGCDALGLEYLPAYGNFLTVKFDDAAAVHEHLLGEGIIVRPLGGSGLPNYLRISVGTPGENTRLLRALA